MTAEVLIMNKEAVAIAADSAVTFKTPRGQKIFSSANKIFSLSKYEPVGLMIYGNAEFMGIPWETIVKLYRDHLNKKSFTRLKYYCSDFISFIIRNCSLIPKEVQANYLTQTAAGRFLRIRKAFLKQVEDLIKTRGQLSEEEVRQLFAVILDEQSKIWDEAKPILNNYNAKKDAFLSLYKSDINEVIAGIFERLPMDPATHEKLVNLAIDYFLKFPETDRNGSYSGIVIAGFGKNDLFPAMRHILVEGMASNILKYRIAGDAGINFGMTAAVMPFAQKEMVQAFMNGIDPGYAKFSMGQYLNLINSIPGWIFSEISELSDNRKGEIFSVVKKKMMEGLQQIRENLGHYQSEGFSSQIIEVVGSLPKDQLAEMAESLVNITSFKRKISSQPETVGGPIDVAVISKKDGLVWIKRKHYFNQELNHHFFANYYGEYREGKKRDESAKGIPSVKPNR